MANTISTAAERMQGLWQARQRPAQGWLPDLQRGAIEQFSRTGFPSTRNENWKYTDVSKLAQLYPEWLQQPVAAANSAPRQPLDIPGAIHLLFIDGIFQPEQSSRDIPASLLVGELRQLAQTHGAALEKRFGQLSIAPDSAFIALNTAFSTHCSALLLPAGTELTRPVYIEHWASSPGIVCHPRLLVELGANSQATLVEHFAGNAATIVNSVAELRMGRGAQLHYYKLQEAHADSWHTAVQQLELDDDASVHTLTIDRGAGLGRNEMYVRLAGAGATLTAQGLLLVDGSRHTDSRITVEHAAPHTTSRERYRAILANKARGVFNGRILVQQPAQKTNAELSNRNLLLNRGAEINSKPELEIYADDVKCAHGSTTGQLDESALFYLLSRGIDPQSARNILVTAFASELLSDILIPAVAERVRTALDTLRFNEP